MSDFAQRERQALCESFLRLGPDAPTLDEPWRARDLAAHLVIRDSRPDLTIGQYVPALKDRLDESIHELAQSDWPQLVDRVRQGPPVWSPTRFPPIDEAVNKIEFFIHHEDLLRGAPGFERRQVGRDVEQSLWRSLRGASRLMFRSIPVGVVLVASDIGRYAAKSPTDLGAVVVKGRVGELILYASGRQRVADVEVTGPPEAVAAANGAHLGLG